MWGCVCKNHWNHQPSARPRREPRRQFFHRLGVPSTLGIVTSLFDYTKIMWGRTWSFPPPPGHHGPKRTKTQLRMCRGGRYVWYLACGPPHMKKNCSKLGCAPWRKYATRRICCKCTKYCTGTNRPRTSLRERPRATGHKSSGRPLECKVSFARLEIRKNFFKVRAANQWNKIPAEIKTAVSKESFKHQYKKLSGAALGRAPI